MPPTRIVPMAIIQLSYLKLLEEISEKVGIGTPQCEVTSAVEGWFLAYIDVEIAHVGSVVQTVRCWGGPSPDMREAREEAAGYAIRKMKCEFGLEIKDVNYEDYILYRNMYDHGVVQYADLLTPFNNLQREYNMLKDCYTSTLIENAEYLAQQVKMRCTIDECRATINHLCRGCSVSSPDPSEEGSVS